MEYDEFIDLLSRIGINTIIEGNNISFMTYDNKERYKVAYWDRKLDKIILKEAISKEELGNFKDYFSISRYKEEYIDLSVNLMKINNKIVVTGITIHDNNVCYQIQYLFPGVKFQSSSNDNSSTNYDIHVEKDVLSAYCVPSGESGRYYLNKESKSDYKKMNEIINSNKYFKIFLEYYTKIEPELAEIYNSFVYDSVYMKNK